MNKKNLIRKLKRGLLFIVVLFICFIGTSRVFAYSELDYTLIENHYSVFTLSGVGRLFYLKIYEFDGKVAYCIELGKSIPDINYNNTNDFKSLGYSDSVIKYINLISYYGYEYPSHSDDYKYYMAAQELIWEYLSGVRIEWTDELSYTGRRVDVESYKEEILSLISKDNVRPSFEGSNYNYEIDEKIEIIDENEVLYNYEIYDDGGLNVYIDNDKLIIDNDGSMVGDFSIQFRKKIHTDGSGFIYYNDVSQKLYTSGDIDEYLFNVNIEISGASLKVNKLDSHSLTNIPIKNGSLEGALYELYDENYNLISELGTDSNGILNYNNLSYGNYYLKEVKPSLGYKLDDMVYNIVIDKEINEFFVYEDYIESKLEIFKTYDGECFESDVIFEIYEGDDLYATIKTDSNGYGFYMLPFGEYEVRQVNSKEGYEKVLPFIVVVDDNSDDVLTYRLDDKKIFLEVTEEDIFIENPKTIDNIIENYRFLFISVILLSVIIFGSLYFRIYRYNF